MILNFHYWNLTWIEIECNSTSNIVMIVDICVVAVHGAKIFSWKFCKKKCSKLQVNSVKIC